MAEELMDEQERITFLQHTLLDKNEAINHRYSAAVYLGHNDSDDALESLIQCACNDHEDSSLLAACGGCIAEIWDRNKNFDLDIVLGQVATPAKDEIRGWINSK